MKFVTRGNFQSVTCTGISVIRSTGDSRHVKVKPGRGGCSDDVFEAVGGVAGQPHALAATTQVLAVRPLHVDVPLLLLAAAAGLRAALRQ